MEDARLLNRREKDRIRKQRERMRKKVAVLIAAGLNPDEEMVKLCEKKQRRILKQSQTAVPKKEESERKVPNRSKNNEEKSLAMQKVVETYSRDPSTRCGKYLTNLLAAKKLAKSVGQDMPEISFPDPEPSSSSSSSSGLQLEDILASAMYGDNTVMLQPDLFEMTSNTTVKAEKEPLVEVKLEAFDEDSTGLEEFESNSVPITFELLNSLAETMAAQSGNDNQNDTETQVHKNELAFPRRKRKILTSHQRTIHDRHRKRDWRAKTRAVVEEMVEQALSAGIENPVWDKSLTGGARIMADQMFRRRYRDRLKVRGLKSFDNRKNELTPEVVNDIPTEVWNAIMENVIQASQMSVV